MMIDPNTQCGACTGGGRKRIHRKTEYPRNTKNKYSKKPKNKCSKKHKYSSTSISKRKLDYCNRKSRRVYRGGYNSATREQVEPHTKGKLVKTPINGGSVLTQPYPMGHLDEISVNYLKV